MDVILGAADCRGCGQCSSSSIVLASASPRRKRLMERLVRRFSVAPARINERMKRGEGFAAACVRLAEAKAQSVAKKRPRAIVIGADTIAYLGKMNCRKTDNARSARAILLALAGRTHYVITGVAVVFPDGKCVKYLVRAAVRMKKITPRMLEWYMKTGEWKGRAGSYDVSGKGKKLVASVKGERETVVGLPLRKLKLILKRK